MAYTQEALGKALEDLTRAYDNFIKNAKDQVVQSLGTEVVDEIKQGVNAYVSAQIDEKIENKVLTKFADYYKNGYIQWPGMPSPLEDASLHFEGYSWYEVNYDGNFFRTKGRNAKAFSPKRLTKEQIKGGDYIFQDDEQGDAIRNITGETAANKEGQLRIRGSNFEMAGAFYGEQGAGTVHGSGPYTSAYVNLKFDASRTVPTAEENRPRNLTFTIWALVKDE